MGSHTCAVSEESNRLTWDLWDVFAPHRAMVTALLEDQHDRVLGEADTPSGTLCLLGAGNANDADLSMLLRKFRKIELVDVDKAALERGVARQLQRASQRARLKIHGGVDLLGFDYPGYTINGMTAAAALQHGRVASNLRSLLGRRCDVAAATGLLSMLVVTLGHRLGFDHATPLVDRMKHGWDEALLELRRSYVHGLAAAVRPGGVAVHVSDLTYRRDATPYARYSEEQIEREHLSKNDFFPGVRPSALIELTADGALRNGALWTGRGPSTMPMWVWCTAIDAEGAGMCSLAYGVTWAAASRGRAVLGSA